MDIKTLDHQYVANTYKRFPVEIVGGHGSIVTDRDGKEYIDLGSGIAVNAFGMGDPAWQEAVIGQIHKFQHTSNLYYTEPCARLAQMLCEKTGMKKVFFSNSGAEANECAILRRRGQRVRHQGCQEVCRREKGPGLLHHPDPGELLPRPDADHPGRHRLPASDSRLRPRPGQ